MNNSPLKKPDIHEFLISVKEMGKYNPIIMGFVKENYNEIKTPEELIFWVEVSDKIKNFKNFETNESAQRKLVTLVNGLFSPRGDQLKIYFENLPKLSNNRKHDKGKQETFIIKKPNVRITDERITNLIIDLNVVEDVNAFLERI